MIWDGIDQRKFPRAKHRCLLRIAKEGEEGKIETFTENIGAGGICVVVSRAFEIFDNVALELELDDGKAPIACKGSIVWVVRCHPAKEEEALAFDTGVEFVNITAEDRSRILRMVENLLKP